MSTPIIDQAYDDHQDGSQPPQDIPAEQSVLGGMMLSKDVIGEVAEALTDEDFYLPKHAAVFRAVLDLFNAGKPADAVTVAAELEDRGELGRVGGAPYLHTLIEMVPTAANASYYATQVLDKAVERRLVEAGTRIVQYGYGAGGQLDAAQLLDRAQAQLDAITDRRTTGSEMPALGDCLDEWASDLDDLQAGRVPPGLLCGMADLDGVINGWKPGQLIVVAARPGLGKSALALTFLRHAAIREQRNCLMFSLEMSRQELINRIVSAETGIRQSTLATPGAMGPSEWDRVNDKRAELAEVPLFIDDTASITMTEIRAKARRIKAKHDLDLIVVDYLQLMTSGARVENRQQEVSEFSRQLKLLAKDLQIPVIVLSQLNRGPEQRADKRPMTSDLRESGAIEQDADVVILLHRPAMYGDEARAGEADLIIGKNRGGPTGTIVVADRLHVGEFAGLAPEDQ